MNCKPIISALIVILSITISCNHTENDDNLIVSPKTAICGSYVKLTINIDHGNENLNYKWFCDEGQFFNLNKSEINYPLTLNNVLWKAPDKTGEYIITCILYNGDRIIFSKEVVISVILPLYENNTVVLSDVRILYNGVFRGDTFYTIISPLYNTDFVKTDDEELLEIADGRINRRTAVSYSDYFLDFSRSYTTRNVNGIECYVAFESFLNLEYLNNNLYLSNHNCSPTIKEIDVNNLPYVHDYAPLENILDLKRDRHGNLFAISSPLYDHETQYSLHAPPIIWKSVNNQAFTEFFRFPDNFEFNGANYASGNGRYHFPLNIKYDMAFDADNNLYIAMPYANRIYKLDTLNNISVFIDSIFCPSSIEIGDNNHIYLVSAPTYQQGETNFEIIKPLEIIIIDQEMNQRVIYQSDFDYLRGGGGALKDMGNNRYLYSGSLHHNIFLSETYKLYFIDAGIERLLTFN